MEEEKDKREGGPIQLGDVHLTLEMEEFNKHSETNLSKQSQVYLISKQFLEGWKEYVSNPATTTKPLLNQDLIIQDSSIILSSQPNNPYNCLVIQNIGDKTILASKELMNVFKNYQGTRILKDQKLIEGKIQIQYNFDKIKFVVVSEGLIKMLGTKQIPVLTTIMSKRVDMKEFRDEMNERVSEYCKRIGFLWNRENRMRADMNLWIIEQDVLSEQALEKYKSVVDGNKRVYGSKVTNINNVRELEGFIQNQSIVFIVELVTNDEHQKEQDDCLYCNQHHDENISCFEFQNQNQTTVTKSEKTPSTPTIPLGIKNIGNTCYINSVLQILFHSPQLRRYFLKKEFKNQVNKQNSLGTFGRVSHSYFKILLELEKKDSSAIDPSEIKSIVSDKNQMFRGYMQQDSQQFLMCLIDLIHEDLKRSDSGGSQEYADDGMKHWSQYISQNNSVITELFSGQYSSTLHCLNCQNSKTIYEPFLNFSLPIPQKEVMIKVVFCAFNRQKLYYQIDIHVDSIDLHSIGGKISKQLKQQHHEKKYKFMNWKYGFTEVDKYSQEHLLEAFLKKEIICYELSQEETMALAEENPVRFVVVFRRTKGKKQLPANRPFWFNKEVTTKDVYRRVWQWLYKSTIQHRLDAKFNNVSPVAIFAAHFIKDPPLQLSLILHPNGKGACYYEKPISINTKIVENITSTLKNMRYELEVNLDKLCQFCDTQMFGKVGAIQNKPKQQFQLLLEQCIEKFNTPQFLDDNTITCESCNKKTGMSKSMDLDKVGEYFIIHLKRFKQKMGIRFKNTRFIDFPFHLDVSKYVKREAKNSYELYGVINHSGTLNSGHYTAYARVDNQWYLFNDHIVNEVSEDDIVTENAYILFYQRQK